MTNRKKKLFIFIQQSILDPASGAAKSTDHFAQLFVELGWQVIGLSTTASEHYTTSSAHENYLTSLKNAVVKPDEILLDENKRLYRFIKVSKREPEKIEAHYQRTAKQILKAERPQLVLTFGNAFIERALRKDAQEVGAKVIFTLHNSSYSDISLNYVDYFIVPSKFLAKYHQHYQEPTSVIYPPLMHSDIIAEKQERLFLTYVNPEPAKGLIVMVTLIKFLITKRPDIPLLIVEGRADSEALIAALNLAGINLAQANNIFMTSEAMTPKDIYQHAKVVLMPSVVEESAGRVAMEAMLNGIATIVSDRGALPEIAGNAAIVLPIPSTLTPLSKNWLTESDIQSWINEIVKLFDDSQYCHHIESRCQKYANEYYSESATKQRLMTMVEKLTSEH
ncbi:glycosyltransferase [Thalassotalea ganghwensis]